jgi:hypothetical protein
MRGHRGDRSSSLPQCGRGRRAHYENWKSHAHPALALVDKPSRPSVFAGGEGQDCFWSPSRLLLRLAWIRRWVIFDVLVVDEPTGTPRHRLRIPHAMDDDAVRLSRISFDTAPYSLGPDRLAFGVRREWVGSSRPNPFKETTLSLYEPRGAALALVLDDLIVERSQGQWDLSCAGETVVTERILRMVPGQKGQDISVLERITQSTSREAKNGECSTTDQAVAPRTIRLSFDGKRYDVPRLIQRR